MDGSILSPLEGQLVSPSPFSLCVALLPYNLEFQVILIGLKFELVVVQMGKSLAIDTAAEGE